MWSEIHCGAIKSNEFSDGSFLLPETILPESVFIHVYKRKNSFSKLLTFIVIFQ